MKADSTIIVMTVNILNKPNQYLIIIPKIWQQHFLHTIWMLIQT